MPNTTLTLTGLTGYVDENSFELLSKAVLETSLAQYVTVRAGLQGNSVDIPLLADDFALKNDDSGTYCGWVDGGTTTISQVNMKLAHPKLQRAYCVNTLRDTFMSQQLSAGVYGGETALPFEQVAASYFTQRVTNYNENYLIVGDTLGGVTYTGLKAQAAAAVTATTMTGINQGTWVAGTAGGGEINALAAAMAAFAAAPAEIMLRDDNFLVVSPAAYKALIGAMVNANLYHYTGNVNEVYIPGSNVRVVASSGIANNDNFKLLTSGANVIMGTDLTSDFDEFKVWYSQDNDEVRSTMKWAVGVAIVQPELCLAIDEQ
jgi:hypothetical protein